MTDRTVPGGKPRTLHVANLDTSDYDPSADRTEAADPDEANVVSSIHRADKPGDTARHYPVLDIDIPATLVPSSAPGHSHLYLDVEVSDANFWPMLDALAAAGVIQPGYVSACRSRGYTSVRLPWIKKEPKP